MKKFWEFLRSSPFGCFASLVGRLACFFFVSCLIMVRRHSHFVDFSSEAPLRKLTNHKRESWKTWNVCYNKFHISTPPRDHETVRYMYHVAGPIMRFNAWTLSFLASSFPLSAGFVFELFLMYPTLYVTTFHLFLSSSSDILQASSHNRSQSNPILRELIELDAAI